MTAQETTSPASAAELHSDALLQASRRLDWRFLLPDPRLRQVAYSGPGRGALLDSLRLFSESLVSLDASLDSAQAQYDLVVVSAPAYPALERAAAAVRPGCFLYVEVHRPFRLLRRRARGTVAGAPQLRDAADYVAVIERQGFGEVAAYWHWPNFENCAEIVPLDDRAAILLAFARRRSGAAARLKSAFGRGLVRSGLLAWAVPCFSVVGRKHAG
jgi:hypothetical protein